MEKTIVIIKQIKDEIKKSCITKETMKDIYINPYYCETLRTLNSLEEAINDDKIDIELRIENIEDIQLENFNLKLKGKEKIKNYPTLEKYIIEYAGELAIKVPDSNIRTLLTSISIGDTLKEKSVIIKKLQEKTFDFRKDIAWKKLNKKK